VAVATLIVSLLVSCASGSTSLSESPNESGVEVSGVVTTAIGDQFENLPSDVQSDLASRFADAYGEDLDDLSEEEAHRQFAADAARGLLRIDDGALIDHFLLVAAGLERVDVADCATYATNHWTSQTTQDELAEMFDHLVATFDHQEFQQWAEISMTAAEAERAKDPEVRTLEDADRVSAGDALFALYTEDEENLLAGVMEDLDAVLEENPYAEPPSDEDTCSTILTSYAHAQEMDRDALAVIAFGAAMSDSPYDTGEE